MIDNLWSLPDGWEWVALENICDIAIGGTPLRSHPEYWGNGYTWVSISDLNGGIIETSKEEITDLGVANSNVKLVEPETILMSFKLTIGKLGIAGKQLYTNEAIAALPIKLEKINAVDRDYIFYALQIVPLDTSADLAVKGRTLNKKKLAKILLPIPYPNNPKLSLDIQQRIVARIESLFGEIKRNRLLLKKMRLDHDELMDSALNEVFSYNYEFKQVPLKQKCHVIMGQSPLGKTYSNTPIGLPLLNGPKEFGTYHPTPLQWTSEPTKICEPEDLLICVRGATTGRINWANQRYCIGRGITAIRPQNKQTTDIRFIAHFIQSQATQILKAGRGSTFPNISKNNLENWKIPDVFIHHQKQLVSHFDFIQAETVKIDLMLKEDEQNFKYLEQAILEKAFRGEL